MPGAVITLTRTERDASMKRSSGVVSHSTPSAGGMDKVISTTSCSAAEPVCIDATALLISLIAFATCFCRSRPLAVSTS
ncbi:hypothetical protein D3C72_2251910 [compost metagenome]